MYAWLTPASVPATKGCRTLSIPDSVEWYKIVAGALVNLIHPENWEPDGAVTPAEAAQASEEIVASYYEGRCMEIGMVAPFARSSLPSGWIACDGATYLKSDYPALVAVLDDAFIVDSTHFKVPDLRGRVTMGHGELSGYATFDVGDEHGEPSAALEAEQMAAHTHGMTHLHDFMPLVTGDLDVEGVGIPQPNAAQIVPLLQNQTADFVGDTDENQGGGQVDRYQPSLALRYGIFAGLA